MFKAYKESPHSDWTDNLIQKGIPLVGTVGGAILGGAIGGPGGIGPGMQMGSGIGNAIGGMVSEKPTGEAQMATGLKSGLKGWEEWRQLPPEKKLDTNETGKVPTGTSPTAAAPATIAQLAGTAMGGASNIEGSSDISGQNKLKYKSMYAPRFAQY